MTFHRIRLTDTALTEFDGAPLVTIPRAEITRVRLIHGTIAEKPWVLVGAGIVAAAIGLAGVALLAAGVLPRSGAGAILVGLCGPLLVAAGLKQGPVLVVETTRGTRKLGFGKNVDRKALPAFVKTARAAGLPIES